MKVNLIPMAGEGSRFANEGYETPKPLIEVSGKPMIVQACASMPKADKWVFVCRSEHLKKYPEIENTLKNNFENSHIIEVDHLTEGQASTCLLAKSEIDPEDSLFIGACDNGMTYNQEKFLHLSGNPEIDALIFSFRNNATVNNNPKAYGWIKVNENEEVQGMSVKIPISETPINDHAVVGSFWFKKGKDFIEMTEQMISANKRINNEFYVDKVFDEFTEAGKKVKVFEINHYICWGTPNDLRTYQYWEDFFRNRYSQIIK